MKKGKLMTTLSGKVLKALSSQSYLLGYGERMSLDPDGASTLGLVVGQQVRVVRTSSEYALYTVYAFQQETRNQDGRMALAGRERLNTTDSFNATFDSVVPHPTYTEAQAESNSDFIERLTDDGSHTGLIVIAPHGGSIENYTDEQAERVASQLAAKNVSSWRCKGWKDGGGSYDRWHITSTELHRKSFPLLDAVADRDWTYCVSFHGYSEADIAVGGAAPTSLKEAVRDAIQTAVGVAYDVNIVTSGPYAGDSASNITNWLTANGSNGVQIEQPVGARSGYWQAIADAVADVYSALI